MTPPRDLLRWARAAMAASLAAAATAAGLAACGGPAGSADPPDLAVPLATGVEAGGGTWATIPMGHLGDPSNTFWQLFYRARGASRWVDQVAATATATNGGLVLAPTSSSITVGVRPYDKLLFSPLISTADRGGHWSTGLIPQGLADVPGSLGAAPQAAVALVGSGSSSEVLTAGSDLSTWSPLVTREALASGSQSSCGVGSLDGVALVGGRPVVAASCSMPGAVGMFVPSGGSWHLSGPTSASLSGARVQVMTVTRTAAGLGSLLAATQGGAISLYGAWATSDLGSWQVSPALALEKGYSVESIVVSQDSSGLLLLADGSGGLHLQQIPGPSGRWSELPAPPAGTQTVVRATGGGLSALAVDSGTMTDWELSPGGVAWAKGQVIQVPIEYGSSS